MNSQNSFIEVTPEEQKTLKKLASEMNHSYRQDGATNSLDGLNIPVSEKVGLIIQRYLSLMFPGFMFGEKNFLCHFEQISSGELEEMYRLLVPEITASIRFGNKSLCSNDCDSVSRKLTMEILTLLPEIRLKLLADVEAALYGDPSVGFREEIIVCYPGFYAIALYRLAHELYLRSIPILPRMITEIAKTKTGIDIHPGATIGSNFFIDHGTGVVIGETTVIGNCVKLYQNVTLGALSFQKDRMGSPMKGIKRHPTLRDRIIVYSGSSILGGDTVIGENCIIGGNVWLTRSVEPNKLVFFDTKSSMIREIENKEQNNCVPTQV